MTKNEGLAQIVKIMRDCGVTTVELNEYIREVAYIMNRDNILLDEAVKRIADNKKGKSDPKEEEMFDLLCNVEGVLVRLPFADGTTQEIVGIFPFKDNNIALDINEKEECSRKSINERQLPEVAWVTRMYPLRHQLNRCLAKLGKPEIDGRYFVKNGMQSTFNWIADFMYSEDGNMKCDWYKDDVKAKARYVLLYKV